MKTLFKQLLSLFLLLFSFAFTSQAQDDELGWPRVITANDYILSIYAPQNIEYVNLRLKSNSAVSVKKGEDGKPTFGMMWTTSILDADRESKMASLASITVDEVRFPDEVSEEQKVAFIDVIEKEVPQWDFEIPIQQLIDSMKVVSSYQAELDNHPPAILFATQPSVLVIVDGEPKFKSAENGYEVILNSAYFIVHDQKKEDYYVRGGNFWYLSKSATGPYAPTTNVPASLTELLKKSQLEAEETETKTTTPPALIISTQPAELIVTEGEPNFSPIDNTNLLYVDNTEGDLFMNIDNQQYYLLISGRWFHAEELKGTWEYIGSDELPQGFQKISVDSKKGNVLVSVAGTDQAQDALYDAQIPQTAAVNKDTKASEVTYNGEPKFEKIKGLDLEYALNTESSVFKEGNRYFLCDNAIWFQSDSPKGPWTVSEERPEEVDEIPADNPQYNTKYVYIYETSPTVVYVGYTPGYYGSYVYGNTVVYGTGFYYNPWYGGYYYHHHYSYGFNVRYNSYSGWSFGFSFGSPYGWYGHSYWGPHYHWGPSYYRPPYYRAGYRPVPSRPIYSGNRGGVNRYQRPSTLPANRPNAGNRPTTRPSTRPNNPGSRPNSPSTRPSNPNARPSAPSTRPSNPSARPSAPSTRPSTPTTRPSTPSNRPSGSGNYGGSRPTTRPSQPASRPAARPASRPAAMPAGRGGGGGGRRR